MSIVKINNTDISFNLEVEKCYKKLKLDINQINDIILNVNYKINQIDSCLYFIPENYIPKNHIFCFDLDNTLIYYENFFLSKKDDIVLLPERFKTLQILFKMGYTIAVFTNQSTMKVERIKKRMIRFLQLVCVPIFLFVALSRKKGDLYRKPETGMWNFFLKESGIKPEKLFFSGDALGEKTDFSDSDKKFALNIGVDIKNIFRPEQLFGNSSDYI